MIGIVGSAATRNHTAPREIPPVARPDATVCSRAGCHLFQALFRGARDLPPGWKRSIEHESRSTRKTRHRDRLRFYNAAMPGASPRCWYYLMREIDPDRLHFSVIVVPIDNYDDEDGVSDWADWTLDTRIVVFCLRLGDLRDYTSSFHSARSRFEAWRDAVLTRCSSAAASHGC